jgi:hypothetical protein
LTVIIVAFDTLWETHTTFAEVLEARAKPVAFREKPK